jgi:hypothetical protein
MPHRSPSDSPILTTRARNVRGMVWLLGPFVLIFGVPLLLMNYVNSSYYTPRCQAYAAAHGYNFITYETSRNRSRRCRMVHDTISVKTIDTALPRSTGWGARMIEHGFVDMIIMGGMIVAGPLWVALALAWGQYRQRTDPEWLKIRHHFKE